MLKRTIVLLCFAALFTSCLKDSSAHSTFEFIEKVDSEGIEIFMKNHKVVEGEYGPDLEKTTPDDPLNMWNTRRTTEITDDTKYDDLLGHAFMDTSRVGVINDAGDTLLQKSGVWLYVNKRGVSLDRPTDSCAVLVAYTGTLLDDKQFTIVPNGGTLYLYSETIIGMRRGMKYFEPGHLKTVTVTPDPGEDGTQDPPYEIDQWKDGGQGWIIMPSRVAYGNVLSGSIPPNSVLVFKVDLYSIAKYPVVDEDKTQLLLNGKSTTIWANLPPAYKTVKLKK